MSPNFIYVTTPSMKTASFEIRVVAEIADILDSEHHACRPSLEVFEHTDSDSSWQALSARTMDFERV